MRKGILAIILATGILSATDFTSMSTEDLIGVKGTVATEEREAFKAEMQSRVSTMTAEERAELAVNAGGTGSSYGSSLRDGSGTGSMGASSGGGSGSQDGNGNGAGGGNGGGGGNGNGGGGRN